jgi:predicted RND superfamily exporter protein
VFNFISWIVDHRRTVVLLVGLITVGLLLPLRHMEVIVDTDQLLPQSHPYVIATKKVEQIFGNRYTVVVGMTARSGTVIEPKLLEKLKGLTEALNRIPGAVRPNQRSLASSKTKNIVGTEEGMSARAMLAKLPQSEAELAALRTAIDNNPVYDGVLISKDRKTAAVVTEVKSNPLGFGAIERDVRAAIAPFADESVELMVTGQPIFLSALEHFSDRMGFLLPIALLVIGLLHFEAFRTIQGLVLPLVTALLAVVWSLGIMTWFGMQLDPFSNVTPILIIAVAAGHAVQILKRYYEAYHAIEPHSEDKRAANRAAVVTAVSAIGPVMVAACVIAAASFLSLLVFGIQSIRTFASFSALGILSALAIELTFIPAVRAMLPPPSPKLVELEHKRTVWDRIIDRLATVALSPRRGWMIVGGLLLAVVAAGGTTLVVQDNSLRSFFTASQTIRQEDAVMNARLAGSNTLYVLIEGQQDDAIKDPAILNAMLTTQRQLEKDPLVGGTISLADFIVRMNRAMHGDDPATATIPADANLVAQYLLLYSMSGDEGDFNNYVDPSYRNAVIQAFVKTDSSAHVKQLEAQLLPVIRQAFPPDVTVRIAGSITTPTAMSEMIVQGKIMNLLQMAGAILLIASVMFRSLFAGLLLIIPLAMTALVNFGLMGFFGIPLQIATSTVAALAVGIGADYAIYFTYRLREELRRDGDIEAATRRAYATAGKAVLYVATAVAGGYGVLIFSIGFNIHLWLGIMVGVAMLVSALTALTLYPVLLLMLKPGFVFGQARLEPAAATLGLLALLTLWPTDQAHAQQDADALDATTVMQRSYEVTLYKSTRQAATFVLAGSDGKNFERKATGYSKLADDGIHSSRLTRFLSPANISGTAVLSVENSDREDDVWVYLPALHKVRRLAAGEKRDSFVGTDFSHGDVIGHKVADWNHTLIKNETVDGAQTAVIDSVPRDDTVKSSTGYGRRVSWVRLDNWVLVRSEFYDETGALLKRFSARDLKLVDAAAQRWQPMELYMKNVQTEHESTIRYHEFEVGVAVPANAFSSRALDVQP